MVINILSNNLCVPCSIPETVKGNARIRVGVICITKHDDVIEEKYVLSKIRTFKVIDHVFKNTYFQKYVLSEIRTFKNTYFQSHRPCLQKYVLLKTQFFKSLEIFILSLIRCHFFFQNHAIFP